jgi:hypothetical protein
MGDQAQNNKPSGVQPPDPAPIPPNDRPTETTQPASKYKRAWKFAAGFLGWYMLLAAVYYLLAPTTGISPAGDVVVPMILSGLLFPLQVVGLILLFAFKKNRNIGWGMLSALGVNLVISLMLGLVYNGVCFIPFFMPTE